MKPKDRINPDLDNDFFEESEDNECGILKKSRQCLPDNLYTQVYGQARCNRENSNNNRCFPCWCQCPMAGQEIKPVLRGIRKIEKMLTNPDFGLEEIKSEVSAIEDAVLSPDYGLEEIKYQVNQILSGSQSSNKTTGPVLAEVNANRLVIKLFNNTATSKTASATVFSLTSTTKTQVYTTGAVSLSPTSAQDFTTTELPDNYVVEFTGLVPGVYGWTSTRSGAGGPLIETNTFRHAELVPTVS